MHHHDQQLKIASQSHHCLDNQETITKSPTALVVYEMINLKWPIPSLYWSPILQTSSLCSIMIKTFENDFQ